MVQQDHKIRHLLFDKWKISIEPIDRKDFEAELWEVCNSFFEQGVEVGVVRERERLEKLNSMKELPLERGKTNG